MDQRVGPEFEGGPPLSTGRLVGRIALLTTGAALVCAGFVAGIQAVKERSFNFDPTQTLLGAGAGAAEVLIMGLPAILNRKQN